MAMVTPNLNENRTLLEKYTIEAIGNIFVWEGRAVCQVKVRYIADPIHVTFKEVHDVIAKLRLQRNERTNTSAPSDRVTASMFHEHMGNLHNIRDQIEAAVKEAMKTPEGLASLPAKPDKYGVTPPVGYRPTDMNA